MARASKTEAQSALNDFANELITDLNKQHKKRIAYNLGSDISPTHVTDWISTGSLQLDYDIANKPGGGFPVGRIVEIFGPPSIGKSHLAAQICKATQAKGGIAVLIDAENATNPENLGALGVNIKKGFVYIDVSCTEEILEIAESTMIKARAMIPDKPVVIIWDSVAASSPKAELEGEYEKNTIGLQARVLSKGMRKITHIIGENRALLVCINQMRQDINAGPYGDPWCVDPFSTIVNWRINSPKLVKVAENVLGRDCKYKIRSSLHDMARYFDAALGTDATEAYNREGTLTECYNPEVVFGAREDGSPFDPNEPLEFFDVSDAYVEVEGPAGYVRVNGFTIKPPVKEHYFLEKYNFSGTGSHRVKVGDNWVPLCEHRDAVKISKPMSVVDITTETGVYMAHDLVHHNTTPGGNAIPFHASVRIRLNSGKQLQNKAGEVVGIKVISHVKKNKVGYPFRKSEFEIHFGRGIVEHEQLFDVLRAAGPQKLEDGTVVSIEGTGAWKSLIVNDPTGEVIVEKKFYKAEFDQIWRGGEYGHWVEKACEKALVKTTEQLDAILAVAKEDEEAEMVDSDE
jgi:protein RecA